MIRRLVSAGQSSFIATATGQDAWRHAGQQTAILSFIVAGAVVTCTTQTQPGLPATSSLDAELQGVSRAAREGIFLKDLITLDFGQTCGQSALALEPNCEVCEFYLQGALQAKLLSSGEVKGTVNCANFLTSIPSRERRCDKHCLDLECMSLRKEKTSFQLQNASM